MTSFTSDPAISYSGTSITNIYAQLPTTTKDDIFSFTNDGKYNFEEGATKANNNDPQIYQTGTWSLSSDEKFIIIVDSSDGSSENYKIIQLTGSSLQWSVDYTDSTSGLTYTFTQTFAAK